LSSASTQEKTPAGAGTDDSVSANPPPPTAWRRRLAQLAGFLERNESLLWWLHSAYALLLGILVMWLGARDFRLLRVVVLYIAFIWLSSFFLPTIVGSRWLPRAWQGRARLVINYFNKNFYQQLLFFVLPLYYSSATFGSRNMFFVALLAASAVLSTMDIVYDRYVSARWPLTAVFFAFNLFACINVMLPVLWSVSNSRALWISAALALVSFTTMAWTMSRLSLGDTLKLLLAAAVVLFGSVYFLPPFIPPAPLSLGVTEFGTAVEGLRIVSPLSALPADPSRIAALTHIKAPLGLRENVRHRWCLDGREISSSRYYSVEGGRGLGFRLWTQVSWKADPRAKALVVDVETEGGQLIGRTCLIRQRSVKE
jgi:hypothetical protein